MVDGVYGGRSRSRLRSLVKTVERRGRRVSLPVHDWLQNRRWTTRRSRFLVVRHREALPSYYKLFLAWIARRLPEVRPLFELRLLPCRNVDWSSYALVVPWLPDTFLYRNAAGRRQALELAAAATAHGVPVVNPPAELLGTSKHDAAARIAALGVRAPRAHRIGDVAAFRRDLDGMPLPLLVREDLAHGGWSPVFRLDRPADVARVPLEEFERPIAVEFIDVRSPADGLVRKWRYLAVGDAGVSNTLQISSHWEVRSHARHLDEATRTEELAYQARPDPNHDTFQRVRRSLGLDFVAFDYSYDQTGEPIVWELNVLPALQTLVVRPYLLPALERSMAATVRMMFVKAGLPVPAAVDELLAGGGIAGNDAS